jgi:hypothetical protein
MSAARPAPSPARHLRARPRAALAIAALLAGPLSLAACRAEARARATMEKHGTAFALCKEITDQLRMKPGEHRCSLVSSMGLDASMKDTGLDPGAIDRLRSEWLAKTGYQPYYIPAELRAPENR